jgi:hypothetical protein
MTTHAGPDISKAEHRDERSKLHPPLEMSAERSEAKQTASLSGAEPRHRWCHSAVGGGASLRGNE